LKKNIKKLFLAAGLLAITGALLTGCGSKKKNAEEESVIKISTAPDCHS
jgi:ABC-type oligopeptide transport system substrate-binding subunit